MMFFFMMHLLFRKKNRAKSRERQELGMRGGGSKMDLNQKYYEHIIYTLIIKRKKTGRETMKGGRWFKHIHI